MIRKKSIQGAQIDPLKSSLAVLFRLERAERMRVQSELVANLPGIALSTMAAAIMWTASVAAPGLQVTIPEPTLTSVTLGLVGAITCLAGVDSLRRAKSAVSPANPDPTSSLVTSGLQGSANHIIHLGFEILLLGWAAILSNALSIAVLPGFIWCLNHLQPDAKVRAMDVLFLRD